MQKALAELERRMNARIDAVLGDFADDARASIDRAADLAQDGAVSLLAQFEIERDKRRPARKP